MKEVEEYIKKLKNNQKRVKNPMILALIEQKINNISHMIEEFCKLRLKKSLFLVLKGKLLHKDVYCIDELQVFNPINKILDNYLKNLNFSLKGESPPKFSNDILDGEYFAIRFLKEVPQIIGADLKRYGPFLIDDIAILPKSNVETLLKHQAVTLINKK